MEIGLRCFYMFLEKKYNIKVRNTFEVVEEYKKYKYENETNKKKIN